MMQSTKLLLVLCLLSWLVACGDDESDPGPGPDPGPFEDSITFRVFTLEPGKVEMLRWVGNAEGPAADSPEPTDRPWVGFGQPFRVEWEFTSANGRIVGYRYRPSQEDFSPYLPPDDGSGDPVWANVTSFTYRNDTPASALEGEDCAGGPDCPELLRFGSGRHRLQVIARDQIGEETELADGTLQFEVNYPPDSFIALDPPGECGDDTRFPQFLVEPAQGDAFVCSFAEGDTIPAGSIVTVRVGGFDRLEANVMTDSFCCDLRLDEQNPEVTYQGRLDYAAVEDFGQFNRFEVGFAPEVESDLLRFRAGPFDYTFYGRTKDEHDRPDPTEATFSFVAGYPPRISEVLPADGTSVLLRDAQAGAPWPENELPYEVVTGVTWYWDIDFARWLQSPPAASDYQPISGSLYRIPLEFAGVPDPREPVPADDNAAEYAGRLLSWAYEVFGDRDPDNEIGQGGGTDNLRRYDEPLDPIEEGPNRWRLDGEEAIEIFIPDQLWNQFALHDPQGDCPIDWWCDMGSQLRREIGDYTLRVQGKTTGFSSFFCQHRPTDVAGSDPCVLDIALAKFGRRTQVETRTFSIRLGFSDPDNPGMLGEVWPPSP